MSMSERDQVDNIVDFLCNADPTIDPVTKQLSIRLRRAAHHLERALRLELAASETETWEFEVLLALYRAEGHRCTVGDLLRQSQVTSGAITNRVARLEERGLVLRATDTSDRRQVLVTMTEDGLIRINQLLAVKVEAHGRVFSKLDAETRGRLNDDLRTLLIALEGPADGMAFQPDHSAYLAP